MKIAVQVTPRASHNKVERLLDGSFRVWVTAPPVKGQANRAVVDALADHLGISRARVRLTAGFTSRHKVLEVDT